MKMDDQGVYIFRNIRDTPILVAYKKLSTSYLTVTFSNTNGFTWQLMHSNEIIDIIPSSAVYIDADLKILHDLRSTFDYWLESILYSMHIYIS